MLVSRKNAANFLKNIKVIEDVISANSGLPQEQSLREAISDLKLLLPKLVDGSVTEPELLEFTGKYGFVLGNIPLPPDEDSSTEQSTVTSEEETSAPVFSLGASHDLRGEFIGKGVSPQDVIVHPINGVREAMISVDGILHILKLQETPETRAMWRDYRKALRKLHTGRGKADNNTKFEAIKAAFAASGHQIQMRLRARAA